MSECEHAGPRAEQRLSIGRRLIIDNDLPPRLRWELRSRGLAASSAKELGWKDKSDVELARAIVARFPGCVLVTGDDKMPGTHGPALLQIGATVATIDSQRPLEYLARDGEAPWRRHIVHMWAHRMQQQAEGTFVRYGERASRPWTARVRLTRRARYLVRADVERAFPELSRDDMNALLNAVQAETRKWKDSQLRWSFPLLEKHVVDQHKAAQTRATRRNTP